MSFKVGDKVMLRKSSFYYGNDYNNQLPPEKKGVIIRIEDTSLAYIVEWKLGKETYTNSYGYNDLRQITKYTRLAKKMFPKSVQSDCGKYLHLEEL